MRNVHRPAGPANSRLDRVGLQLTPPKIDRLLDVAGQQGSHVLEIGTGWGELCIRAAARGPHLPVTLSVVRSSNGWLGSGSPRPGRPPR